MPLYNIVDWQINHLGRKTSRTCTSREAANAKEAMMSFLGRFGEKACIICDDDAETATVYNSPASTKSGWTARKA
ncbi:hypothetical protein [Candidatus Tokpelaia sp.]|uniref:hypothetical protein n=1 Tax=Candidatus Tokpelaia sp. TaxID=2233777 RepID=UPI00123A73AF|nr:hypothetical protein [Candidatus Tokpelaia sp.]KAA6405052.1 hypothetical protein DPQ22_05670 [Candidatus Tokpelaia sp.]